MPVDEPLYPVNLRISGRRCLVVGGESASYLEAFNQRDKRRAFPEPQE